MPPRGWRKNDPSTWKLVTSKRPPSTASTPKSPSADAFASQSSVQIASSHRFLGDTNVALGYLEVSNPFACLADTEDIDTTQYNLDESEEEEEEKKGDIVEPVLPSSPPAEVNYFYEWADINENVFFQHLSMITLHLDPQLKQLLKSTKIYCKMLK